MIEPDQAYTIQHWGFEVRFAVALLHSVGRKTRTQTQRRDPEQRERLRAANANLKDVMRQVANPHARWD